MGKERRLEGDKGEINGSDNAMGLFWIKGKIYGGGEKRGTDGENLREGRGPVEIYGSCCFFLARGVHCRLKCRKRWEVCGAWTGEMLPVRQNWVHVFWTADEES